MTAVLADSGALFELTILGYWAPEPAGPGERPDSDYDANWLDIAISVERDGARYEVRQKAQLFTWEVADLVEWIELAAAGIRPRFSFSGVEMWPDFELRADFSTLEVQAWQDCPIEVLPVHVDAASLHAFADGLRRELAPFSLRKVKVNGPAAQFELKRQARSGERTIVVSSRVVEDAALGQLWRSVLAKASALLPGVKYGLSKGAGELILGVQRAISAQGGAIAADSLLPDHGNLLIAVFVSVRAALAASGEMIQIGEATGFRLQVGICAGEFDREEWWPGGRARTEADAMARRAEVGHVYVCEGVRELAQTEGIDLPD